MRAPCAQTAAGEVRRALASYREVRDSMSEGLRFYMSLQEAIATLAQQAGDYVLTRRLQRCALFILAPDLAHPRGCRMLHLWSPFICSCSCYPSSLPRSHAIMPFTWLAALIPCCPGCSCEGTLAC